MIKSFLRCVQQTYIITIVTNDGQEMSLLLMLSVKVRRNNFYATLCNLHLEKCEISYWSNSLKPFENFAIYDFQEDIFEALCFQSTESTECHVSQKDIKCVTSLLEAGTGNVMQASITLTCPPVQLDVWSDIYSRFNISKQKAACIQRPLCFVSLVTNVCFEEVLPRGRFEISWDSVISHSKIGKLSDESFLCLVK